MVPTRRLKKLSELVTEDVLNKSVYDRTNPLSMINIIPVELEPMLLNMRDKMPIILTRAEADMRLRVKPDQKDDKLRLNFWDEYNYASAAGKRMSSVAVLRGVCSAAQFYSVIVPNRRRMMWMLSQPESYACTMRNILHRATDRLLEIVSLPIVDANGKVDTKVVVNILRAFQLVDMRVKGSVAQTVNIKQQSMHLHRNMNAGPNDQFLSGVADRGSEVSVNSLDIKELERLERRIANARKDAKRMAETAGTDLLLPANAVGVKAELPRLLGDEIFEETYLQTPIDNDPASED